MVARSKNSARYQTRMPRTDTTVTAANATGTSAADRLDQLWPRPLLERQADDGAQRRQGDRVLMPE
jgi:hypothetical protein